MTSTEQANPSPSIIVWESDEKEMILIPSGSFLMGSGDGPENERPCHEVALEAFYIDRYPVTNEEYKRFTDATGHPVPCYDVAWAKPDGYNWDPEACTFPEGQGRHPVVLVTWEDALAYARWAGKRLPTEAEWERAARGTDGRRWPWGDDWVKGRCNSKEAGIGGTTPVDHYSPEGDSPDGVGDVVGNVWEWTANLYRPYPYRAGDGREALEATGWRVLRGGSWHNDLTIVRCAARLDGDFLFFNNVGFRCAVSANKV